MRHCILQLGYLKTVHSPSLVLALRPSLISPPSHYVSLDISGFDKYTESAVCPMTLCHRLLLLPLCIEHKVGWGGVTIKERIYKGSHSFLHSEFLLIIESGSLSSSSKELNPHPQVLPYISGSVTSHSAWPHPPDLFVLFVAIVHHNQSLVSNPFIGGDSSFHVIVRPPS